MSTFDVDVERTNRYLSRGLLIDTNLLLVLLAGRMEPALIAKWGRTQCYTVADYELLEQYVARFAKLVTTPNVLTEVSNLVDGLGKRAEDFWRRVFGPALVQLEEHYLPSAQAGPYYELARLGLADCVVRQVARERYLVLTDDLDLVVATLATGGDAVNFNHIRTRSWR